MIRQMAFSVLFFILFLFVFSLTGLLLVIVHFGGFQPSYFLCFSSSHSFRRGVCTIGCMPEIPVLRFKRAGTRLLLWMISCCVTIYDSLKFIPTLANNPATAPPKLFNTTLTTTAATRAQNEMPSSTTAPTLAASVSTVTSLITHCGTSLTTPSPAVTTTETIADPLSLLHDTATLTKAHVTRLSVALRPPITEDAAIKFVKEFGGSIVPSLVVGVASCDAAVHGKALKVETRRAVDALLAAIGEYMDGVLEGGDRLKNTGVVWSAADRVIGLKELGLCGVVEVAVRDCAEMVEDARTELKEWVEDNAEEEDDDAGSAGEDEDEWDLPARKGKLDEAVKNSAEEALKKMKLVTILFGAARKRRLLGEGRLSGDPQRVDRIAEVAKEISGLVDDLGMAFYEEEELEVAVSAARLASVVYADHDIGPSERQVGHEGSGSGGNLCAGQYR
jgi:hypothetical protein